jgi:hypothetical protein
MAATFTGSITRKARGSGKYIVATPAGTAIITVNSTGTLSFFTGAGSAQGAAITAPTAPGAVYAQAEAASMKTAVDAIRVLLTNLGLTL